MGEKSNRQALEGQQERGVGQRMETTPDKQTPRVENVGQKGQFVRSWILTSFQPHTGHLGTNTERQRL